MSTISSTDFNFNNVNFKSNKSINVNNDKPKEHSIKSKLVLAGSLLALGVAGAYIVKKGKLPSSIKPSVSDIKPVVTNAESGFSNLAVNEFKNAGYFSRGKAFLEGNKPYTGIINSTKKDGSTVLMEYYHGVLRNSTITDLLGNQTKKTYTYDGHRLESIKIKSNTEDLTVNIKRRTWSSNAFSPELHQIGIRNEMKNPVLSPDYYVVDKVDNKTGNHTIRRIFDDGSFDILNFDKEGVVGTIKHFNKDKTLSTQIERQYMNGRLSETIDPFTDNWRVEPRVRYKDILKDNKNNVLSETIGDVCVSDSTYIKKMNSLYCEQV